MKKILLAIAVMGLFGCSSAEKEVEETHAHTQAEAGDVTDQAKAAIENAAEDLKNAADDLKTAATETASEGVANATTFEGYEGTEKSKATCTSGDDVRTITVLDGTNGGCGVVYNKFGTDKTVAVAKNVVEYCSEVQNKIKGNLEAASFTCQ